jgi:imidazole glycerol-phosphate synthase subunit HisH
MQTVAIIDYGSGNLHSASKAFERAARDSGIAARVVVTDAPEVVAKADRVVLPGVGAFADCKRGLDAVPGMRAALDETVLQRGQPFLGICVGMQLLATRGLEFETTQGLGWIGGDVVVIKPRDHDGLALKIPHMGWNTLSVSRAHQLLDGIKTGPNGLHAYFVHSFHLQAAHVADVIAETDHGVAVTALVGRDNIAGTQFHPEKSQQLGLKFIANFLKWAP